MKFALVIPTRGDRPEFINQCNQLIRRQTKQPDDIIWVDYKPKSNQKDITQRYRWGVNQATQRNYDFVVFWEDDDWYHPKYLEWLIDNWVKLKKPDFFGVGETYYYHHGLEALHYMKHPGRTSAFSTLVKIPWKIPWPEDNYSFLDMHIHKNSQPITIMYPSNQVYAIGIKHGLGVTGGGGHRQNFPYSRPNSKEWFYQQIQGDRVFYDEIKNKIKTIKPQNKIIGTNENRGKHINSNTSIQLHQRRRKIKKIRRR